MAAFEWPLDKLSLINSALSQTGDNFCNAANDGSDEWTVASPAYERALAYLCEGHQWSWLTDVRILQPAANVPDDDQFDTAYTMPADLIHLIWVRIADLPSYYGLLNGQLVCNAKGGTATNPTVPPAVPAVVTIKGVFSTDSDPVFSTPTFIAALQAFVMSGIYRGLHENTADANGMLQQATMLAQEARTRHDQQKPKTAMFNSRISASRRVRRPWPIVPPGWGGTGRPG